MDLGLRGRTALVGGGSAGLGRASAERLAGEGGRLALWSRGGEALTRAAAEIRATHSEQLERSIPAGRYGTPDELGAYVAWLCSEPAGYQTGTFVPIDGGMLRGLP